MASALAFLRRQWPLIAAAVVITLALAGAYLLVTPATYLGRSSLLLDTRKLQLFEKQSVLSDVSFDTSGVESQTEILRSETLARSVVDELNLVADPEFVGGGSSLIGSVLSAVSTAVSPVPSELSGASEVTSSEELTRRAVAHLRSNLTVQRVRLTYVLEIGFTSRDARKATRIATAVAEAYITDQTQAKQYTTKRAAAWLHERMTELREQAVAADRAVQDFRTRNNLLRAGGTPLDEQQIAQLSTQLTDLRERTTAAQARMSALARLINAPGGDATMTAALQNEVMNRLRQQYVDVSRREADLASKVGPDHQAVINLRKELRQIENAAMAELRRTFEAAKTEFEQAAAREKSAQQRLEELTRGNAEARQEQGALQVLESTAKAYQNLHESFLQRFFEATQQQTVATTEARVISSGERALKVAPKASLVLMLGAALGLMLGGGAAFARENLDQVFRTPRQLEQAVEIECLGVVPAIAARGPGRPPRLTADELSNRVISHDLGIARQVVLTPFSRFTETIRSMKVAVDTSSVSRDLNVVGLVSAVPAEGKSTISSNLAQLAAHAGARVLLVDCDLRNPSLTRTLAPHAVRGLLEVLRDGALIQDVTWRDTITGLDFLPAVLSEPISHTSEVLASTRMQQVVTAARTQYDYIILDFPPLAPVVDARAASHLVDAFMFVVQWGKTSREVVTEALESAETVRSKIIGAVLNRANPRALKKIEAYKGASYHQYYTYSSNS